MPPPRGETDGEEQMEQRHRKRTVNGTVDWLVECVNAVMSGLYLRVRNKEK